jgi:TRAP-type C4-dicarboxylate transport system permease small subunit
VPDLNGPPDVREDGRLGKAGAAVSAVADFTALVGGIGFAALMGLTVLDVVLRETGGEPIKGMLEYVEVWQPALVFLGMMGAQAVGAHARTPLVVDRMPRKVRPTLRGLGLGLSAALVLWLSHLAFREYRSAAAIDEVHMGVSRVPVSNSMLVLSIGMLLFAIVLVAKAIDRKPATSAEEDLGSLL